MTSDITTLIKHLRCPALTSDDDIAPYLTDASQAASGRPLAVFSPAPPPIHLQSCTLQAPTSYQFRCEGQAPV